MQKQEKSVSIIINEAKEKIADTINNTGLSPTILEMILAQFYNEIRQLAEKEYKHDMEHLNGEHDHTHNPDGSVEKVENAEIISSEKQD